MTAQQPVQRDCTTPDACRWPRCSCECVKEVNGIALAAGEPPSQPLKVGQDGTLRIPPPGVMASDCSREEGHHFHEGRCVYCTAPGTPDVAEPDGTWAAAQGNDGPSCSLGVQASPAPSPLLTPRAWQLEAMTRAAKLTGSPEGALALVEAKRYGLMADELERIAAGVSASRCQSESGEVHPWLGKAEKQSE